MGWYKEQIPFFECPDEEINTTYYYRWELITKHLTLWLADHRLRLHRIHRPAVLVGPVWRNQLPGRSPALRGALAAAPRIARDYLRYWFQTPGAQPRNAYRPPGGVGLDQTLLQAGYIIFRVDPRSASGKGVKPTWTAYKHLGVGELEDIKDALGWLKKRDYVDGSRIGMSGHSYGGYLTSFCMTHSDLFAAGIAGAPVTDWRDYDSIYTERYMDTPQNNPEGYDASSVVKAADKLHGRLLILHGNIDDNVSIRNTMRFIYALQQADKDFELMVYPNARHGIGGAHYTRLQREFILRTLGGPTPKNAAARP